MSALLTNMPITDIPIWAKVTLGSGGLIGALTFLFNLLKHLTDKRNENKQTAEDNAAKLRQIHEREIELLKSAHRAKESSLQRELERKKIELENVSDFRQLFEEAIDDLANQSLTDETRSSLRKIKSYLARIQSDTKLIDSMRIAAQWVEYKKEEWLKQAIEAAVSQYPELLTSEKQDSFGVDISNYLGWLRDSLHCGFCYPIEDYVPKPAIGSPFPYRTALQTLEETEKLGDLKGLEASYLQDYIDELVRIAPTAQ